MEPAQQTQERPAARAASVHFERERGVTDVVVTRGMAHVTVRLPDADPAAARLALLQSFAAGSISIFLVKLHPCAISFGVRANLVDACEEHLRAHGADFTLLRDLALVTTIAGAMRDLSGVICHIYETMLEENIGVRQTGDAYNAVLCLVAGEDSERAARALRRRFSLEDAAEDDTGPSEGVGLKAL
uniref:Aspartate kinase n=1 Tax=uncultured Armatimonadetes bacterium TaxID=157466 RepID=A0A6J4IV58_9BACT|nr:hypothetical protein AVDCRST_MAG63-2481 [uncultured Armatimonadetes bacterium]